MVALLKTKLFIPPVRAERVPRPRLLAQLNAGVQRKLILVAAPAGFGKTTLVAEWLADFGLPILDFRAEVDEMTRKSKIQNLKSCWLSLDTADNDPARFWTYLIAALQTACPDLGETALAMLQTPQPSPIEAILTDLINEIAALPSPLLLALDDYHLIEARPIHEAVTFLLDHLPSTLHIALLTRADPPLPLARLRVRDQLTELRAADLRFTDDEAAAFLNDVMGLALTAQDIAALETRTEGWIAGLQLAALSLQHHEQAQDFVTAFTGSHHYIVDYLTEEVLSRQPPQVQTFLLRTAILEQLSGPLCDVVTGQSDGQAMLEMLEKANLFLIPLDDERHWYRYHHLLAHSLSSRLLQMDKDLVPHLHRRAAEWFEANSLFEHALAHWVQARDFARATQLIEERGTEMLTLGEMATLRRWIEMLPGEVTRERPWLCVLYAWTLLLGWDVDKSLVWIEAAQQCQSTQGENGAIAGHIAALQAYIAGMQNDDRQSQAFCQQALELLPQNEAFLRGLIAYLFGVLNLRSGDLDAAWAAIEEAGRISRASGVQHISVLAQTALGVIQSIQGRFQQAWQTYHEALRLAEEGRARPLPVAALTNSHLAAVAYEWNELDVAEAYLARASEQSRQWGSAEDMVSNTIAHTRVRRARGDPEGAWRMIEDARAALPPASLRIGPFINAEILYRIARGELDVAERLAQQNQVGANADLSLNTIGESFTLARLRLSQGRHVEVGRLLDRLQAFCQTGLTGPLIEVLRLRALNLYAQKQTGPALAALRQALSLAEPGGYIRSFVDEGPAMAALLAEFCTASSLKFRDAETEKLIAYAQKLLTAFPDTDLFVTSQSPNLRSPNFQSPDLIEPLSARELEILHLVAAGKTNKAIGAELFLATGTVKKHLNNIFGKLSVQNRTACVARARELHLLIK
ncbi:MAG: hypothetical protein JXA21_09865 [Anaerolineae bacterium]|nr:hypothetical protein [Anaerolineae bacterium]